MMGIRSEALRWPLSLLTSRSCEKLLFDAIIAITVCGCRFKVVRKRRIIADQDLGQSVVLTTWRETRRSRSSPRKSQAEAPPALANDGVEWSRKSNSAIATNINILGQRRRAFDHHSISLIGLCIVFGFCSKVVPFIEAASRVVLTDVDGFDAAGHHSGLISNGEGSTRLIC